jgi:membrane protease subunit HflK
MAEQQQQNIPPIIQNVFKNLRYIILAIIIVVLGLNSFFQVDAESVGVVTRFGAFVKTVEPGLNFKIPFVEKVYLVPVERQQKLEFGFRTETPGVNTVYSDEDFSKESIMLTGDLNLADVEWVVQYRISDPKQYLFMVREPDTTMRDISESAMRQIVGDRTVNEVLTVGRSEISSQLQILIQDICTEYSLGVQIEQVVLQDVNPPEKVKDAFNEVNRAQQEKETSINQAQSDYNKIIPRARGRALETIQKAEGYATERVNRALGETDRFNKIYAEYMKAPAITKKRIYLETMAEIIPMLGDKIITDEKGQGVLPLLQMNTSNKQ